MKKIEKLQKEAEEVTEKITEERDYYDHKRYFSVNVKRYNDGVDVDGLIAKYPKKYQKGLKDIFTDEWVDKLYWQWLEDEERYLLDVFEGGVDLNWRVGEYYDEDDAKIMAKRQLFFDYGFAGRSGGHFVFDSNVDEEDILEDIRNTDDVEYIEERLETLKDLLESVLYIKNDVSARNKSLKFEDEIIFRLDEELENVKAEVKSVEEVKKAKKLAKRNGYVLAKLI